MPRNETQPSSQQLTSDTLNTIDATTVHPTQVPWEEALKYTMHLALRDRSRNRWVCILYNHLIIFLFLIFRKLIILYYLK